MKAQRVAVAVVVLTLCMSGPALAFDSGSTGADGAFNPAASVTVTLPTSGVFNFTTVNVPSGVTVRFTRNAANTPVTLLATGNVTIAGTIDIGGANGAVAVTGTGVAGNGGAGGPGGFDGGSGGNGILTTSGGAGLGPGGGGSATGANGWGGGAGSNTPGAAGGTHSGSTGGAPGGVAYGTANLLPLIGGSGGGGGGTSGFGFTGGGGGGGGGALLIASSGTITLSGTISSRGGNGGNTGSISIGAGGAGSGGAIRLVATTITGSGTINVIGGTAQNGGGTGSIGRVRIEAETNTSNFGFSTAPPSVVAYALPSSVTLPSGPALRIASVAGVTAPSSPASSYSNPDIVLPAGTTSPVTVNVEASNIPLGTTLSVRVAGRNGPPTTVTSTPLAGTLASSTASASVTIPTNQPSIISATASFTLIALGAQGPVFVEGEEVDRVRVTASMGGPSHVAYITKSGRELSLPVQ